MSSTIVAAAVNVDDELFTLDFWRQEFKRTVHPHGRSWRKRVKEVDPSLNSDVLHRIKAGRGSLENTRRVVKALLKLEIQQEDKTNRIASKLKRHNLSLRH